MAKKYIDKEAALTAVKVYCPAKYETEMLARIVCIPAADVVEIPATGVGDLSDGYHTFNGLYYQRMTLFAALVKQNKDRAWKSYRHEGGELCFGGGWFIVGIDTPEGSYTYHYENKDFDLFDCEELPAAKHWDGHTEADVTRLLSIPAADAIEELQQTAEHYKGCSDDWYREACDYKAMIPRWIPVTERLPEEKINPNTHDFEYVLCVTIWGDVRPFKYGTPIGQKEAHFWNGLGYVDAYITHWMPLPEPPKEE